MVVDEDGNQIREGMLIEADDWHGIVLSIQPYGCMLVEEIDGHVRRHYADQLSDGVYHAGVSVVFA